jgi:class 3 adenylate cyclase
LAAIFSDLLIAPPEFHPLTGFEHSYGPLFIPFDLYCFYALTIFITTFRYGMKSAKNALEKQKIAFSGWGLFIGLSFAFLLGMILPLFGIQTHSLSMIPFALIAMCFIFAIIKHQYLEIQKNMEEIEKTGRLKRYLSPQVVETIMSGQEKEPELRNERREVTIFFSDLRGFTNFSDRVEPEEVMQLLKKYHAEMGKLIFKYDGTLERFAGDGIMVISGAPVQHQDHALRAVKMALEMKAEVEGLKKDWERKDYALDIGMGISTGYATIGNVGFEGRMDYTAIGKVTNLAARLCEDAQAGQILISKSTLLHVENQVKAIEIGQKDYKGFQRSITTFEVIELL